MKRGLSPIALALKQRCAVFPASPDERDHEVLGSHLEAADPYALAELLESGEVSGCDPMIADALLLHLSRSQEAGSFPPVFKDKLLARRIYEAMRRSSILKDRIPQYYRDALSSPVNCTT